MKWAEGAVISAKFKCQPSAEIDFYIWSFVSGNLYSIGHWPVSVKTPKQEDWEVLGLNLMVTVLSSAASDMQCSKQSSVLFCERLKIHPSQHTFNRFHQSNYFCTGERGSNMLRTGISYSMANTFPNEGILVGGLHQISLGMLQETWRYPLEK